jgi:cysteinyl-tRNA synthetase
MKNDPLDFALWKAAKPGEPSWDSPWGLGRPGWHIECSAMAARYLGSDFAIHGGGNDLIFPHHENEIAQSEAATGQPFVRYWLHNAHLHLSGEKMARRVGNIYRPADVYAEGYSPAVLRYALLATHYRAPLEYGDETLDHARAAVERLSTAVAALDSYAEERADDPTLEAELDRARHEFRAAMDDDLNVSPALAAVFDLVRETNRRVDARSMSTADARRAAATLRDFDTVFAVLDLPEMLPEGAAEFLEQRAAARAARDFAESDRLRDELAGLDVTVDDTRDGQRWRISRRATDA